MQKLNFVELIEKNPITSLSNTYNNKLLLKIKENFTGFEQQVFISSFYCYINYNKITDFVIDLDNIWKWLDFTNKANAKKLLVKYYIIDKDYKNSLDTSIKQELKHGGQNIQKFYLNIKTFKSLCLKAGTKKADEIHEYYIKLEQLIQEVLEEETNELKTLLSQKENTIKNADQDKFKAIEKTLVAQFPVNNECIYFGTIDNANEKGDKLIKFGHSNNLPLRVQDHHKNYDNFILRDVFKVHNRQEIENAIKIHNKIKSHLRTIEVNGKNKNEILAYDSTNFTINRLSKYIKDIISEKTYSIENFNKIIQENLNLKKENEELYNLNYNLQEDNKNLQSELNDMREKIINIEEKNKLLKDEKEVIIKNEKIYSNSLIEINKLTNKFAKFIDECCDVNNNVEVDSMDIIGQFRIWNREKPKRETFQELNKYLRTRFFACRLNNQTKNQCVHGFRGITLKAIKYIKQYTDNIIEDFIFDNCIFSPDGRCSTNKVFDELIKYKKGLNMAIDERELDDLKVYLNNCKHVLKGTVHLHNDDFTYEGYYGISLKNNINNNRIGKSATSKKVYKVDINNETILNTWESIVKASIDENISASKMSRSIKNKTTFYNSYYYRV